MIVVLPSLHHLHPNLHYLQWSLAYFYNDIMSTYQNHTREHIHIWKWACKTLAEKDFFQTILLLVLRFVYLLSNRYNVTMKFPTSFLDKLEITMENSNVIVFFTETQNSHGKNQLLFLRGNPKWLWKISVIFFTETQNDLGKFQCNFLHWDPKWL